MITPFIIAGVLILVSFAVLLKFEEHAPAGYECEPGPHMEIQPTAIIFPCPASMSVLGPRKGDKAEGPMMPPTVPRERNDGNGSSEYRISDRRGGLFILDERLAPTCWVFEVKTMAGATIGRLNLTISEQVGSIVEMMILSGQPRDMPRGSRRRSLSIFSARRPVDYRGRGLGSLLMLHALQKACDHRLHGFIGQIPDNSGMLAWYTNLGFSCHACDVGLTVWRRTFGSSALVSRCSPVALVASDNERV
jgi:GNAT superfamily N-acetyltransferase